MGGLFSYESKPMQILMFLGDIIILNVMYLIFCIPIFTIGAAQAGMYTACKVLLDKEDDSSVYAAFWRGFTSGFGTVTLAWGVMTLVLLVVGYGAITAILLGAPAWTVCIAVAVCAVFQTLVPAFHSRFGCKWWQLIRNSWFMLFAHPLRSIAITAMVCFPLCYLVYCMYTGDIYNFMSLAVIWGTLYFGTAFCFSASFLKKPFTVLSQHFNETHGLDKDGNPLPPTEEVAEETEAPDEYPDDCEPEE